jgi:hypothetical protein
VISKAATADSEDGVQYYKALIDEFVDTAKSSVVANRIRAWEHSERANLDDLPPNPAEAERIRVFASMSPDQREMVASLIEDERRGAIHDLASKLEWLTTSQGLEIRWHGVVLPESPFGSYHYDFICRIDGDAWPDDMNLQGFDDANS